MKGPNTCYSLRSEGRRRGRPRASGNPHCTMFRSISAMKVPERNFWLTTLEAQPIPVRPLPQSVDVAVLGAGFTGLSAARTLAKSGARVAVLEAETVGWGASCRNGGMVLSGLKLGIPTLMKRYGREVTKRMYAASLESIDCVEEVAREEGITCDFVRCGHLEVACKAKHF